jgi:hypothetical protein
MVDGDQPYVGLRRDAEVLGAVELLPFADDVPGATLVPLVRCLDEQHAVEDQEQAADRLAGLDEHVPLGKLELAPDVEELRDEVLVDDYSQRPDLNLGACGDGSDQAGRTGRAQGIAVPTFKPDPGELRRV